ncbi:MAG: 2-C-methyl-D-erythritol 2,4-cyclodiphosphate synthase [Phycisphaerales bacterium]|nr:2-C-methyl-D-erythritol 2,4-cyclodiphosphate synthase [Phycisphaerales bacterium]
MTSQTPPPGTCRIGHGYDLHRLEFEQGGAGLMVGGVLLAAPVRAMAHSDGDVLLHALTDALLGALGEPDIGQLFPDTDPANKGRESWDFVRAAVERVRARGYAVGNVDGTVVLQSPKLSPLKDAIRECVAGLLDVRVDQVNIKGKTGEGVGPVGEGKAIEAHVVVLLRAV